MGAIVTVRAGRAGLVDLGAERARRAALARRYDSLYGETA